MGFYQTQFLYVAEYKNGVVKVGRTGSRKNRLQSLQSPTWFRSPLVRFHACGGSLNAEAFEAPLIHRMARLSCGRIHREWFKGVRFSVAVQLAEQMTKAAKAMEGRA